MKTNLYHETVEILEENSKSIKDIVWIGTKEATIDIARFIEEAKHIESCADGKGTITALDLIIVGVDWWLSRGEYDGFEWWIFNTLPQRPRMRKTKFDLRGHNLFE